MCICIRSSEHIEIHIKILIDCYLIKIAKVCIYVNYRVTPYSNKQFDLIIDHHQIKQRLINLKRILARMFLASECSYFDLRESINFVPWEKRYCRMADRWPQRASTPLVMIAIVIAKERTGGIEVTFPRICFLHER